MNQSIRMTTRHMFILMRILCLFLLSFFFIRSTNAQSDKPAAPKPQASDSAAADRAWEDVVKAGQPPPPPDEWRTNPPSEEVFAKYRTGQSELAGKAADKAKDFYTRFPSHPRSDEAREKELELLGAAVAMGKTNLLTRLETLETARLKNPQLTEDERFQIRLSAVQRNAMLKMAEGQNSVFGEFEKGARILQKEFPKRPEVFDMLLAVASQSDAEKGRKIAEELVASGAPDEIKDGAKDLLKKVERLGKPLQIKFTDLKGKEVDLQKMAGKVVLIDFWATWCGPCVAELPKVKAAYEKFHSKGFEIVGISFDREKDKLEKFVAKEKIPWSQHFDAAGAFGEQFSIAAIPTMWLVDKKGLLRELNAREGLEEKVEKLLSEKP